MGTETAPHEGVSSVRMEEEDPTLCKHAVFLYLELRMMHDGAVGGPRAVSQAPCALSRSDPYASSLPDQIPSHPAGVTGASRVLECEQNLGRKEQERDEGAREAAWRESRRVIGPRGEEDPAVAAVLEALEQCVFLGMRRKEFHGEKG